MVRCLFCISGLTDGEKLAEPYGQVGYLDFLRNRREGVQVIGVAVDPRLAVAETKAKSVRSIAKFREFMNIEFPILLDDGTLLRRFGDPRAAGASLPIWVVVDKTGDIVDYHSGLQTFDPRHGLKELDTRVSELLK